VVIVRRAWWEKAVLLLSVIPIALIANATRVVATGLLYQYVSGEAARKFSHDAAGWVMIVFAAGLFALVLWYLGKLVRDVEPVEIDGVVRHGSR
jgi:exosortase/archaeosortase family protein